MGAPADGPQRGRPARRQAGMGGVSSEIKPRYDLAHDARSALASTSGSLGSEKPHEVERGQMVRASALPADTPCASQSCEAELCESHTHRSDALSDIDNMHNDGRWRGSTDASTPDND